MIIALSIPPTLHDIWFYLFFYLHIISMHQSKLLTTRMLPKFVPSKFFSLSKSCVLNWGRDSYPFLPRKFVLSKTPCTLKFKEVGRNSGPHILTFKSRTGKNRRAACSFKIDRYSTTTVLSINWLKLNMWFMQLKKFLLEASRRIIFKKWMLLSNLLIFTAWRSALIEFKLIMQLCKNTLLLLLPLFPQF